MKKIFFVFVIILPLFSYCQNWQWAKQAGGNATPPTYDYGQVITDGTNYYLCGTFSGAMYLQTDTFFGTNGNSDFYIIKYDNNGNELWALAFGGYNGNNESEVMTAVYDTISNSIYLAGIFYGTMQLDTFSLTSNGYARNFIAKMDLNGNFIWGKKAWIKNHSNNNADDRFPALFVRPDGIIYVTTSVLDTAYFDSLSVIPGGCLAKFDSNGNCFFVRHFFDLAPGNNQGGFGIKFINTDLICYGSFRQTFIIDTGTLISNGDYDILLARADSNGNLLWIKQFGFGSTDYLTGMGIDNSNNLYAVGGFTDSISFNGNKFYNSTSDFIMIKYDDFGNYILGTQGLSSTAFIDPGRITTDGDGNSYIAGSFSGSASFGTYNISTSNANDMFLASFNNTGNCLGVIHFGKASGTSVVTDNSGNPVVAGVFSNTVTIGNNTFTSLGPADIYLAKCDIITGNEAEKQIEGNQLIIYANPNAGKCNITIPDAFQHEKNLSLSIFDSYGKLIQQIPVEMNENKIKLNLQAEPKGIYSVTLSNGNKSYYGKIVFE